MAGAKDRTELPVSHGGSTPALDARYAGGERCHSQRDGDCIGPVCPQTEAGEPAATGRWCPLLPRTEQDEDDHYGH